MHKHKCTVYYCILHHRDSHRPPWPFADLSAARLHPNSDVHDLTLLVSKILGVFRHVLTESPEPLKEKWARIALQVCPLLNIDLCGYALWHTIDLYPL